MFIYGAYHATQTSHLFADSDSVSSIKDRRDLAHGAGGKRHARFAATVYWLRH